MTIMFHPYQEKKMEGVGNSARSLAIAIDDICNFALNQEIPICLPGTVGTDFFDPYDYSRIVYFPDLTENP